MPLVPVATPAPVPVFSGFDYVTVDAARRRVYAAHTGSRALLIVDADTGTVVGQVRVGPLHGVAVDPATGHVFTGDGEANTVSEVDPVAMKVLRSADVGGAVDAIAFDPALGRVYADEDDGTHIFVVDAKTMKSLGNVMLPGHKPEYLAVDPRTHDIYQNISDLNEFVVVDPQTLRVKATIPTPELQANHPLQYDAPRGLVLVGGTNGVLSGYSGATRRFTMDVPQHIDQCDLDPGAQRLACAGGGSLALIDVSGPAPRVLASVEPPKGTHTVAIDPKTGSVWIVYSNEQGDFALRYRFEP